MASKATSLVVGVGVIAVVAIGAAGSRGMLSAKAASSTEHPAATAASDKDAPARRHGTALRQWKAGTSFVYAIDSAQAVSIGPTEAPARKLDTTIAGRLALTIVEATADGVRLRAQLTAARHRETGADALDDAALAKAFYVTALPDGELQGFAFARGISGSTRGALKGLATSLQLVARGPVTAWRATEQDASGEYDASYRRDGETVHKAKERYLRTRGSRGLSPVRDPAAYQVKSSIDFTLDATGWPRTVSDDETLDVKAGTVRLVSRSRTNARLVEVVEVPGLRETARAEEGSLEPEPEADAEGFAAAKQEADRGLVAGASYATLVADLGSSDVHAKNHAMGRASALFRLAPDEAEKAASTVLQGDLDDDGKRRLIGALGGAGTEQAQVALASILASKDAPADLRRNAAVALGLSENPTDESEEALRTAMASDDPHVAATAILGEGNLIKRMNASGGDTHGAVAALVARLRQATTDAERALCLQGLGNTGDAGALVAIESYLGYAESSVRAAAVFALRFMSGDQVDRELTTAMGDPDVEIRRAAVKTLAFRSIAPLLPAVLHLLQTEGNNGVRLAIVTALQLRKADDPAVVDALRWAAANDPAPEVQKAAQSALAGP